MLNFLALVLQQSDDGAIFGVAGGLFGFCCSLIVLVLIIAGMWQMYQKAGKPGWAAIIPIYNLWVLLEIVGRPGWWIILFFIPFVNFVAWVIVSIDLANSFGKGIGYALGILIFPYIFYLLLGFGDAVYVGPGAGKTGF
jgi:hypothetical protein